MKKAGKSVSSQITKPTVADLPKIQLRRGPLEVRVHISEGAAGRLMTLAMLDDLSIEEALSKFLNESDHLQDWLDMVAKA